MKRFPLMAACLLLAVAFGSPAWSQAPAVLAPHYMVFEGKVCPLQALQRGGELYLPVVESATCLGIETDADKDGLTLRRAGKSVVFSPDMSMVLSGSQLQAVSPPLLQAGGSLYGAQSLLRRIFAQLAPPFSLSDTPPKADLKNAECVMRAGAAEWTLEFSRDVAATWVMDSGSLQILAQGARLEIHKEGTAPEGMAFSQEKLPLGDLLTWRWNPAKNAFYPRVEKESGTRLRLSFGRHGAAEARRPLKVVVLDPGHGGSAAGAVGKGGTQEKDVSLSIARILRSMLEKKGFEVHMTRETDADVPLLERAELANSRAGDLFVSIHANASRAASARGAETYFLSYEALDDESRTLAQSENMNQRLPEPAETGGGHPLRAILWHMAQAQYLGDSAQLAEEIQRRFNAALSTPDRGVKQAPFAVLMGASMPAVLVEVGFISNEQEEARLASEAYQRRLAEELAESVLSFKALWDARMAQGPVSRP